MDKSKTLSDLTVGEACEILDREILRLALILGAVWLFEHLRHFIGL